MPTFDELIEEWQRFKDRKITRADLPMKEIAQQVIGGGNVDPNEMLTPHMIGYDLLETGIKENIDSLDTRLDVLEVPTEGALLYRSVNQALVAGFQDIQWDIEAKDIGGQHAPGAAVVTATKEGWYKATFTFNLSAANTCLPLVPVTGSGPAAGQVFRGMFANQQSDTIDALTYLNVGDSIRAQVFAGGAVNLLSGIGNSSFTVARVG